jgi:xanthine dehydrogenase accessory factor
MTHELVRIIHNYKLARDNGLKTVLATVVKTKGSSYRRAGVRMLINENQKLTGAVSGGCVEKEIVRQAQKVFTDGNPSIMTYDGRYRLGCEGIIYILIERFEPSDEFLNAFESVIKKRRTFSANIHFTLNDSNKLKGYTQFIFDQNTCLDVCSSCMHAPDQYPETFSQTFNPVLRLLIVGAEHDAVQLCTMASLMGWEVYVVASEKDPRTTLNFPGVSKLLNAEAGSLDTQNIDEQTAVVLMTHSFVRDLEYLQVLKASSPCYFGLLGPARRKEKLFNSFMEQYPDAKTDFFDSIHGPAGLHLGSETPQEIAVSVLAEILSVIRKTNPMPLKNKKGTIHSDIKW